MINYELVKNRDFGTVVQTYTARDSMLYALGIGIGTDPLDPGQLRFVYEKNLQAVPTMASVLCNPGAWYREAQTGIDAVKLVHGEQSIRWFKPLAGTATVSARHRIVSITDKGPRKGAVVVIRREIRDEAGREVIAEVVNTAFLRGDGGYSALSGQSDPGPEPLPAPPARAPDVELELPTLPQQALIFRLSGDYNPLHADPDMARAAGFPRPILHGLSTYGMGAHAVLRTVARNDAARLVAFAARFTAPVYPGETLRFQLWERDSSSFHLRATAVSRSVTVLNNGVIHLA
jgi:acyl dehydratase